MSNQRLGIEIGVEKVSFDPKGNIKEGLQTNLDAATKGLHLKVSGISLSLDGIGSAIQQKLNEATKGLTLNLSGMGAGASADISGIEKSLTNLTAVVTRVGAGIQDALNRLNGDKPRSEVQKVVDAMRILDGEASKFNAKGFKFEIKSDISKPVTDIQRLNKELADLENRYAKINDLAKKSHYFNPAVLSEDKAKRELGGTPHKENLQLTANMLEDVLGVKFSGKSTSRGLADFIKENFDAAQKVIKEEGAKLKQQMQNIRLELETAAAEKPLKKIFDVGFYEKGSRSKSMAQVAAMDEAEARKLAEEMVRNAGGGHAFDITERTRYNETAAMMQEYKKREALLKKFGPKDAWQEAAVYQGMLASLTTQMDVKDGLLPKTSMPSTQVSEAEVAKQRALVDKLFQQAINSPEYLAAEKSRLIAERARGGFRVEPPGTFRVTAPAAVQPTPQPPAPPAPREAPPIETYFKRKRPRPEEVEEEAAPPLPKKKKAAPPPVGGGGEGGGDGGEKPPKEDRATLIMKRLTEAFNLSEKQAEKMKAKIEAALKMEGVEQGVTKLIRFKDLLIQVNGEVSRLSNISESVKQAMEANPNADVKLFSRSKLDPQIRSVYQDIKELSDKAIINGVPQEAINQLQQLRRDAGHALTNKLTSPDDLVKLKDRFLQLNAAVGNDTKIIALQGQLDKLISKYSYLGDAAQKIFSAPALTQNYATDAKGFASAESVQKFGAAIGEARTNLKALADEQKKIDDAWAVRDKVAKGWSQKEATDYVAARRRDYDAMAQEEKKAEASKNGDMALMHATLQKQKKAETLKVAQETAAQVALYEAAQDKRYQQDRIASGWEKQKALNKIDAQKRAFDLIAEEEKKAEARKNADLALMHSTLQKEKQKEAVKIAQETAAQIAQYEHELNQKSLQTRAVRVQETLQNRLKNITEATEQYNAQQAKLGKPTVSYDALPVEAAIGKVRDGDTAAYAKTLIDDLKRQITAQAKQGTFDFNLAGSIQREAEKIAQVQRDYRMLVETNPAYQFRPLDTSVDYTRPLKEIREQAKAIKKEFQDIEDTFKLDKAANRASEALSKSTHDLTMFKGRLEDQVNAFNSFVGKVKNPVDQEKLQNISGQLNKIYGITDAIPGAPSRGQLQQLREEQQTLTNMMREVQRAASGVSADPFANFFKGIPRMGATVQELQDRINALNVDTRKLDGGTWNSLVTQAKKYRMTIDETTGAVRDLNKEEQKFELFGAKSSRKEAEINRIPQTYKGADVSGLRTMQQEIADLVKKGGGAAEIETIEHKFRLLAEAIAKVKAEAAAGVPAKFFEQLKQAEAVAFKQIGDLYADRKATSAALQQAMKTLSITLDDPEKINAARREWGKYNQEIKNGLPVAKEANNIFSFLGDNLGKMALRLTQFYSMRYVLFGVSAEFREAAAAAMKFSQNIHDIAAISGASKREMDDLGRSILDIARSTRFTSDEVAGLMQLLAQAGVSAAELPTVAQTVGQFASATGTKPEMAADLVTTGLNVFNYKASETIKVTNALTAALNLSKLTSQGLGTAFNYLAPQAEQLGMSMKQTLGIIATMAQAGIKPSTIGTGASQLLKELSAPKPRLQNMLDYYGIKADTVDPLKNDFADIIEVFSNATGKMGEQGVQVQHIMSALETRVGRALVTAMSMGSAAFREMTEAIAGSNAAWIAFYKSMDGAEARMNQIKQNFQAAMIGLFDAWKPFLSATATGLKNFTNWMNSSTGQAVIFGASLLSIPTALYAIHAAIKAIQTTTAGAKFLSFFPFIANPYIMTAVTVIGVLAAAYLAFKKDGVDPAVKSLETYNKEMFKTLEAQERSQAGLREAKMVTTDGNEVSVLGQYEQAVRKYGMASKEAMELKKQQAEVEKDFKGALLEGTKEYNAAVKNYGESSREAMAAKENLNRITAKGSAEEAAALKAYNDAVRKNGENSKEAMTLKQKVVKLTDDSKVSLNKLKAEYPEYLGWLNSENLTVQNLIKAYADLDKARYAQEEKDVEHYNKNVGPELLMRAAKIKVMKEAAGPRPIEEKEEKGLFKERKLLSIADFRKQNQWKEIDAAEAEYKAMLKAAQPEIDRLLNTGRDPEMFVQGELKAPRHFGVKPISEKKDPPSNPLPKTQTGAKETIPEFKDDYDAIKEKKKAREELISLIKMDGTSIEELKAELEKIDTLQQELEPLLIAQYQTDAREKDLYLDKKGNYQFRREHAAKAQLALESNAEWKEYFEANKESGKGISKLYYDYRQEAAKKRAQQEVAKMQTDTASLFMDETKKIEGYQRKFDDQMQGFLDTEAEAILAKQEANAQRIITSTFATEERKAKAVIEAKRIANEKIDKETARKIKQAEENFAASDESVTGDPKNFARLLDTIEELKAGGETRKRESDRKIDLSALTTYRIFNSDNVEKTADRDLRIKQQTLGIEKNLANSAEEVHQIELAIIDAQMKANAAKQEGYEKEIREYDAVVATLEAKIEGAQNDDDRIWYEDQLLEIQEKYDLRLQGIKEKLIDITAEQAQALALYKDQSNTDFLYNLKKGWDGAAKAIGTYADLMQRVGGTAFTGFTNAINDAVTMLWDQDDTAIRNTQNSIAQLNDELKSYQEKIDAIKAKGTLATGQDKANLADYAASMDEINQKLREQEDILDQQTNAWRKFKDSIAEVLKDIAKEIQRFLIQELVQKFMSFLASMIGSGVGETTMSVNNDWEGAVSTRGSGQIGRSEGGFIPLGAGKAGVDSVPSMLMPGEVVIRKEAVDYYGADTLLAYNEKRIQKFAEGGVVGGSSSRGGIDGGKASYNLQIVNVADPSSIPPQPPDAQQVVNIVSFSLSKKEGLYRQIKGIAKD